MWGSRRDIILCTYAAHILCFGNGKDHWSRSNTNISKKKKKLTHMFEWESDWKRHLLSTSGWLQPTMDGIGVAVAAKLLLVIIMRSNYKAILGIFMNQAVQWNGMGCWKPVGCWLKGVILPNIWEIIKRQEIGIPRWNNRHFMECSKGWTLLKWLRQVDYNSPIAARHWLKLWRWTDQSHGASKGRWKIWNQVTRRIASGKLT